MRGRRSRAALGHGYTVRSPVPIAVQDPSSPHPKPYRHDDASARLASLLFVTGTFFGMGLMFFVLQFWSPGSQDDVEHYREVRDLVLNSYVGEVDEEQLLESALRGMLGELDDYSTYYYAQEDTAEVDRDTTGQMTGIGVVTTDIDGPVVRFPVEDSPALAAGVRVGDRILRIDGVGTEGMAPEDVSALIRGPEGSTLTMRVEGRDGSERPLEIERRSLPIPSVRRVRFIDEGRKIGYLVLTSFSNRSVLELDAAVSSLQAEGLQALVIDLRFNRGGVLRSAVEIARRFIPEGVITSTEGRGTPYYELADAERANLAGLPLVVLVDGNSASASEVLAGALQDHRAAVLVGTPTYGKGLVQTIRRYPERSAIAKLTTSYYYTPAHRNVQRGNTKESEFGLVPDIEIVLDRETHQTIFEFLTAFEPPASLLPDLRAWSDEANLNIQLDPPADPQLDAALALLRGERTPLSSGEQADD